MDDRKENTLEKSSPSTANRNENNPALTYKKSSGIQKLFFLILSAIIAFGVWIYASSLQNTEHEVTFEQVPITIEVPEGYSIVNSSVYNLDVTVTGRTMDLQQLSKDDIKVYADGKGITESGKHTLDIEILLPDNITLKKQSLYSVVVDIDKWATASLDFEISLGKYEIPESLEVSQITSDIKQITISGPAGKLQKVSKVSVYVNVGLITESTTYSGEVKLFDINGSEIDKSSFTFSDETVPVSVQVSTQKTVPVNISFAHNYFNNLNATVTYSPQSITIKGEKSVLDGISEISISDISESQFAGGYLKKSIPLPENVHLSSDVDHVKINVTLKDFADTTYRLPSSSFKVNNPNNYNYTVISKEIMVSLRGKPQMIKTVSRSKIIADVDLSSIKSGTTGTISVPVKLEYPSEIDGFVYELGNYSVQVNING